MSSPTGQVQHASSEKPIADRVAEDQTEIPVVVAVHIRPLIYDEIISGCRPCLSVADQDAQVRRHQQRELLGHPEPA
jgi:hypothetical protein